MEQNLQTRSGNRIVVTLDGQQVGLVQSVRMSDDYSPEPASGIGDIHVVEHVPTMARHSISVQTMVLNKKSLRKAGIAMLNGDAVLRGLVFDITSFDKDTGEILRKYTGCSYASGEADIQKHSIVMSSGQFNALDVTGDAI
jgi:hypothetical protein